MNSEKGIVKREWENGGILESARKELIFFARFVIIKLKPSCGRLVE